MDILLSLLSPPAYIGWPQGTFGWLGWSALLVCLLFLTWRWRKLNKPLDKRGAIILVVLTLLVVPASLFLGVRLPAGQALPPPGMPVEPSGAVVMTFAAIPWVLAAGLLGPTAAVALALLSGILIAAFNSHNPFVPVSVALVAILFAGGVGQRYRTRFYRLLRHPLVTGALVTLLYGLIFLIAAISNNVLGTLVTRIDYALTHVQGATLALAYQMLVACLIGEIALLGFPAAWGVTQELEPSPPEKSLQTRFFYSMAPLVIILAFVLMAVDWVIAGNAAKRLLQARMEDTGRMAAESIPYFFETGQNLILELASDPNLSDKNAVDVSQVLAENVRRVPFFNQLYLLDNNSTPLAGYPEPEYAGHLAPLDEQAAVKLALNGLPVQSLTIPPADQETAARISFVAAIHDKNGQTRGVLIGHTPLAMNAFTQPVIASLQNLAGVDGQSFLVDQDKHIVYHQDANLVMTDYHGPLTGASLFYENTGPEGTRQMVLTQQAYGYPWSIVITVPSSRAQQLAFTIAAPLLGLIALLALVAILILRFGLRFVTGSLITLSYEAARISQGQLEQPLAVAGDDEVALLRRSFEQMRVSLKARLEELNRLLTVSQGVASSLEMSEAVSPILDAALAAGACSARVVLSPAALPELDGDVPIPFAFGAGRARDLYSEFDQQILSLTEQQAEVIFSTLQKARQLRLPSDIARPEALMAVALRHENQYYGCLYVVYDRPHSFAEEEVRFLSTLAGQAALAAANTRLFLTAEIGRQRLAAILASTPDPVLVTDQKENLLLANPAAWQVLGMAIDSDEGQPIDRVIRQRELVTLLRSAPGSDKQSVEVSLPNNRIYLATATSVLAEGQRVGRICVLRDITHFKELDALKSEFVSTVSHDLRSPLTLVRGYAAMLEIVGELNEQQRSHVRRIVGGVESMSRLVENLLDLGRIEAGIDLQLEMVPVYDIVEQVVNDLQLEAKQKKIQMSVEVAGEIEPLVEADQALLNQALHNLVHNAIKFNRPEGKVTIRLRNRMERMIFEVRDTGTGISPMDQPRLFEKFYRGGQGSSKDQRGTGLGLAIVKSIAERHGGQVYVESQLGKGSVFYLAIPIRQPARETLIKS